MNEIKGNFWDVYLNYDAVCCTTNMVVKSNGELVMGKGIAKDFNERFPGLAKQWGERTQEIIDGKMPTNIIVSGFFLEPCRVSFPTKHHWKDKSDIKLIERSAGLLYAISQAIGWKKILVPRPGCSNGGLNWEKDVKPILEKVFDDRFDVITNEV